jgi:hypothetical protein
MSENLDLVRSSTKAASLFDLHGGEVTKIVQYFVRAHALADLGLAA